MVGLVGAGAVWGAMSLLPRIADASTGSRAGSGSVSQWLMSGGTQALFGVPIVWWAVGMASALIITLFIVASRRGMTRAVLMTAPLALATATLPFTETAAL